MPLEGFVQTAQRAWIRDVELLRELRQELRDLRQKASSLLCHLLRHVIHGLLRNGVDDTVLLGLLRKLRDVFELLYRRNSFGDLLNVRHRLTGLGRALIDGLHRLLRLLDYRAVLHSLGHGSDDVLLNSLGYGRGRALYRRDNVLLHSGNACDLMTDIPHEPSGLIDRMCPARCATCCTWPFAFRKAASASG